MACYEANFNFLFILQQIFQDNNSLTILFLYKISLQAVYNEYGVTAPNGLRFYAMLSNFG
jgi:hypothetical protein